MEIRSWSEWKKGLEKLRVIERGSKAVELLETLRRWVDERTSTPSLLQSLAVGVLDMTLWQKAVRERWDISQQTEGVTRCE